MVVRFLLGAGLGAMLTAAAPVTPSRAPVTVVVPEEAIAAALRAGLRDRLSGLGVSLHVATEAGNAMRSALEDAAAHRAASPDLVLLGDAGLATACAEGLLRRLDDDAGCGIEGPARRLVLGWDERRDAGAPSWRDFWELARLPGKRGLPRRPDGTLEIALMAAGVAPPDIYGVLATKAGVDRAFRKLDQLRPYVVWWTDGQEALRVLGSGAVLMTAAPAATLLQAAGQRPGIGVQWRDSLAERSSWAIPAASLHPEAALRVLGLLRDARVAAALDAAPVDARPLVIDDGFWAAHAALAARFASWLAR